MFKKWLYQCKRIFLLFSDLFVHGFAVDEKGLKMSKSIGNVINPEEILLGGSNLKNNPAYGVDVLRY